MSTQDTYRPWWRRLVAAIDGLDIGFTAAVALIAAGALQLWGVGVAMLVTGGIGLAGTVALLRRADAAARERDR